jgi:ceramide glucosyltransferase
MEIVLAALLLGAAVYSILSILAARRYLSTRESVATHAADLRSFAPISILKPLAGLDAGLESNLRTFFEQDYPSFEILFAVRDREDPAVAVIEKLQKEYPRVDATLMITGEPPYPNAKVFSLDRMLRAASHELVVMSDSDTRVEPNLLRTIAAEFQDPGVGVVTCPYRALAQASIGSRLEATGINTDFLAGVLVARMLEGMHFALGPTIAARRSALHAIGGFKRIREYLAEDFVMGKFAAEAGFRVILSSYVIEHHIGGGDWRGIASHRLRWVRSTRRSRRLGYIGQLFTMTTPIALIVCAAEPGWWPAGIAAIALRLTSAWVMSRTVVRARIDWRLLPVEDVVAFLFWIAGFFGSTIEWRGRRYRVHTDGRFELVTDQTQVAAVTVPDEP